MFKCVVTFAHAGVAFMILNCTAPLHYPPGKEILKEKQIYKIHPKGNLQAKLKSTVYRNKTKSTIITLVSTEPLTRYKLEFKGPLGAHLGEFYHVNDSGWVLAVPSENLYLSGNEESIQLPGMTLDSMDINFALGFLWGQLAPSGNYRFKPAFSGRVIGTHAKMNCTMSIDEKTGQIKWVEKGGYRLEYSKYSSIHKQILPRRCRLYHKGILLIEWVIEGVNFNPTWKRSPFFINKLKP